MTNIHHSVSRQATAWPRHPFAILVTLFLLFASQSLSAQKATTSQLLNAIGAEESTTVVYLNGPMIKSVMNGPGAELICKMRLAEISSNTNELRLYICKEKKAADMAARYVTETTTDANGNYQLLSKVNSKDGSLRIYGKPNHNDPGYSSLIVFDRTDAANANLMIFKGNFRSDDIMVITGQADYLNSNPTVPQCTYLSNTSHKYLEIEVTVPGTGHKNVSAVYHYTDGRDSKPKTPETTQVKNGNTVYRFHFGYTTLFGRDYLKLKYNGEEITIIISHKFK